MEIRINSVLFVLALALVVVVATGCAHIPPSPTDTGVGVEEVPEEDLCDESSLKLGESWIDSELCDASTGEVFTASQFKGKPILFESFAVWCPICTQQQKQILDLHDELGDSFVSISIDTDPNEDEGIIRSHVKANGFTWRYAVSPALVTKMLIDEFGPSIVSVPSAPMILICEDGSYRKLGGRTVRSTAKLKSEIEAGCP